MRNWMILFILCFVGTAYAADWPRDVQSSAGTITIYQPQIDSFKEDVLDARSAVSVTSENGGEPVFGVVWLECHALTDRVSRTVTLTDVKVNEIKFPAGSHPQTATVRAALEEEIPRLDITFSLDELLVGLETAQKENESAQDLDLAPPEIIVTNHPAVLVRIDGDPQVEDIEGTSLRRVVNTPFFVVQEPGSGTFYLHGGDIWYSAAALKGPWRSGAVPPQQVADAYKNSQSSDVAAGDSAASDVSARTGKVPDIVVTTEPAELISSDGALQFSPINGTGLLYASNTPNKLFMEVASQNYYLLISGRWYSAKKVNGPWSSVAPEKLPADFAKIPPGSERDDVLASVPGTTPAKEAVLDAQIPQMAEVDRSTTSSEVQYDGDPQFQPIENTPMEYAVNSPTPVIHVSGRYYECDRGVWFESAAPRGPWGVCIAVPPVIYTIPPRSPVYYVRYVRVYRYTPTTVYVGYTSGYTGSYVYRGTVVYGTGYHYHPWFRRYYFPRPWTWGFAVYYDPWTGWSMGYSWWRPNGWFAYHWGVVRPGWWGPVGYRPYYRPVIGPVYRAGYHPIYRPVGRNVAVEAPPHGTARTIGATRGATLYDHWNAGVRRPVREVVTTSGHPNVNTDPGVSRTVPPEREAPKAALSNPGAQQQVARGTARRVPQPSSQENNVYATPDGKVMRKTPNGWQQRENNAWKPAGNGSQKQKVDSDSRARARGAERSSSYRPPPQRTEPKAHGNPPKEKRDGNQR